jgi:hypothetical protein
MPASRSTGICAPVSAAVPETSLIAAIREKKGAEGAVGCPAAPSA